MTNLLEKLTNESNSYLNKYGGSLIFAISSILICSWISVYYSTKSHLKYLKTRWNDISCNPMYMPLAGQINAPEGVSPQQYTINNIDKCTHTTLNNVAEDALSSINKTHNLLNSTTELIDKDINATRTLFSHLRASLGKIFTDITGRTNNVFIPFRNLIVTTRDIVNNTLAVCVTGLYIMLGGALSINSFVFIFLIVVIIVLVMLIAVIVVAIIAAQAVMFIPFIGFLIAIPFIIVAIAGALLLIAALIVGIPAIILCVDIINIIKQNSR